jgi:HEAT repeat protein
METEESVPAFINALEDEDERIRQISAQSLTEIGWEAADAVAGLIPGLEDEDRAVRWATAQALAAIGPAAEAAVPNLTLALDDEYWRVRQAAAEALQNIGPGATAAVPALIQTIENARSDYHFRLFAAAAGALANIGRAAVPALVQTVEEGSDNGREAAAGALGSMGPEAVDAVPALTQALADEDGWVRLAAFYALTRISPTQKFEFSMPLELANESIEPETSESIIAFIQTTEDSDWMSTRAAVEKLGGIGPGKCLISTHIQNLESNDISTRQRAAHALGGFGPDAAKAVPALIRAFDDEKPYVRLPVVASLGNIGPKAREAVPVLVQALWDKDSTISWNAGQSLGKIGPEEGVVSGLTLALEEGGFNTRSAAADGLALIGPAAKAAVPTLIRALQDDESWIRDRSLLALKSITGEDFGKNVTAWQDWRETQP